MFHNYVKNMIALQEFPSLIFTLALGSGASLMKFWPLCAVYLRAKAAD